MFHLPMAGWAFLVGLTLISGCVSHVEPTRPPATTDCPNPSTSCSGEAVMVAAAGCLGIQHNIITPAGVFVPDFPPGIKSANSNVYGTLLENYICKQATIGTQIVPNLQIAYLVGGISNPDSELSNSSFHRYVFDIFTNSPALANLSSAHGLAVKLVPDLTLRWTPLADDYKLVEYVFPAGTTDYDARVQVNDPPPGLWKETYVFYYLNGSQLNRFFISFDGKEDTADFGVVRFGPESYWAKHSSKNESETLPNYRNDASMIISFDGRFSREV
jgi:hypothetical protein